MSRIRFKKFSDLNLIDYRPLPSRPVAVVTLVMYGRTIMALGRSGVVYTNEVPSRDVSMTCGNLANQRGFFECLKRLNVLDKAIIAEVEAEETRSREASKKFYAARSFVEDAAKLGLRLTKHQAAACKAASGKLDL